MLESGRSCSTVWEPRITVRSNGIWGLRRKNMCWSRTAANWNLIGDREVKKDCTMNLNTWDETDRDSLSIELLNIRERYRGRIGEEIT